MPMRSSGNENEPTPDLGKIVARCRADRDVLAALLGIYAEADSALGATGAVCMGGGACCKFDLFEHRLYATAIELALLTSEPAPDPDRALRQRCPYQTGPACGAYPRRPLGCRSFFCDPINGPVLHEIHERFHHRIRRLHETLCVPYAYTAAMAAFIQLLAHK